MMNKGEIIKDYTETIEGYFGIRDFDTAIQKAKELYYVGCDNNEREIMRIASRILMKAYYQTGDYLSCFRYGEELIDGLPQADEKFEMSVYQFLAILFYELKDYRESADVLAEVIQYAERQDDYIRLLECCLNYSQLMIELKTPKLGLPYIDIAMKQVHRFGHNRQVVQYLVDNIKVRMLIELERVREAKRLLDEMEGASGFDDLQYDHKVYYENYGRYYEAVGDSVACVDMMILGYELAVKAGDLKYMQIFLEKICKHIDCVELVEERVDYLKKYTHMIEEHQKSNLDKLAVKIYAKYYNYIEKKYNQFDPLTDVLHRGALEEALGKISSCDDVTCLVYDVDDFKKFNDTFGHLEGDEVLKMVTQGIVRILGARGSIYRFGGDEFVILFNNETEEDVMTMANEILGSSSSLSFAYRGVGLTISIGIANTRQINEGGLLHAADMALYAAKARGKNCIEVYEG